MAGGGRGAHRPTTLLFGAADGTLARAGVGGLGAGRRGRRAGAADLLARAGAGAGVGRLRRGCCRSWCAAAGRRRTSLGAGLWVAGLVAAHGVLGDLLAATTELDRARGAAAGAALGGLVAVTVTLLAPPGRRAGTGTTLTEPR